MTPTQANLSDCVLTRWQPGFNDPYLVSWIMVAIYLMVAVVAGRVVWRRPFPAATARRERVFWGLIAGVLVFMAINKQGDLQTLLLSVGHCLSRTQGWFGERDLVKRIVVTVLAVSALGGGALFLWGLRRTLSRTALPLTGLFLMASFIVLRAAEMFHFRGPIMAMFRGNWPDRILELSGPLVIFIAALVLLAGSAGARAEAEASSGLADP